MEVIDPMKFGGDGGKTPPSVHGYDGSVALAEAVHIIRLIEAVHHLADRAVIQQVQRLLQGLSADAV